MCDSEDPACVPWVSRGLPVQSVPTEHALNVEEGQLQDRGHCLFRRLLSSAELQQMQAEQSSVPREHWTPIFNDYVPEGSRERDTGTRCMLRAHLPARGDPEADVEEQRLPALTNVGTALADHLGQVIGVHLHVVSAGYVGAWTPAVRSGVRAVLFRVSVLGGVVWLPGFFVTCVVKVLPHLEVAGVCCACVLCLC